MTRFNERTRLGALLRGTEKRNKPEIKRFGSDDNIPEQEPSVNIEKSIQVKRQEEKKKRLEIDVLHIIHRYSMKIKYSFTFF